jgi:O-antigen ligase
MDRLRKAPLWIATAFLVYMPFHIFLAQSLSLVTGGLDEWKAAKDVVLMAAVALTLGLVLATKAYKGTKYLVFLALAAMYVLIHLITWLLNPSISHNAALLGATYNNRLLWFVLLGWGAVLVYPGKISVSPFMKLIISVSTAVCLLGVLQYVLPKDILTHLGYSVARGVKPNFFIDDKPDLPRIMSTLRDPNSLGAYLILPIVLLVAAWFRRQKDRLLIGGLLLLHGLALFLTFSRSAWAGVFLSVSVFLLWNFREQVLKALKSRWPIFASLVLVLIAAVFLLRNEYVVQNVVFHSDESTKQTDSNNLHIELAKKGIEGIIKRPQGHGPGTAGLVSIHTQGTLTENYFIQIGYEVGIIGLLIFLVVNLFVVKQVLLRRRSGYAPILLASFIGITLCNLLLLSWSNEAVACQWWLFAGLLIGYDEKLTTQKIKRLPRRLQ